LPAAALIKVMLRRMRIGHWLGSWIYFVSIILLVGTTVGATLHLLIGLLIFESPSPGYLLARGAQNGFFYSGVWAGGLGIVLCFVRGHRENQRKRQQSAGESQA
jgi:hypothetical protein